MTKHKIGDRTFGFTLAGLFMAIFAVGALVFDHVMLWAAVLSALFAILALVRPGWLMPVNRVWMLLAGRLAIIVNTVLMASVFAIVIVPYGLVMRIAGRDAMKRKWEPAGATYWQLAAGRIHRDSYQDLF